MSQIPDATTAWRAAPPRHDRMLCEPLCGRIACVNVCVDNVQMCVLMRVQLSASCPRLSICIAFAQGFHPCTAEPFMHALTIHQQIAPDASQHLAVRQSLRSKRLPPPPSPFLPSPSPLASGALLARRHAGRPRALRPVLALCPHESATNKPAASSRVTRLLARFV